MNVPIAWSAATRRRAPLASLPAFEQTLGRIARGFTRRKTIWCCKRARVSRRSRAADSFLHDANHLPIRCKRALV
jgi:hypothetical protein